MSFSTGEHKSGRDSLEECNSDHVIVVARLPLNQRAGWAAGFGTAFGHIGLLYYTGTTGSPGPVQVMTFFLAGFAFGSLLLSLLTVIPIYRADIDFKSGNYFFKGSSTITGPVIAGNSSKDPLRIEAAVTTWKKLVKGFKVYKTVIHISQTDKNGVQDSMDLFLPRRKNDPLEKVLHDRGLLQGRKFEDLDTIPRIGFKTIHEVIAEGTWSIIET
ncbi:MAG: hypothetical protein ACFFD4_01930 [Candidatus Odinarchaeota archaeon]